MRSLGNLVMPFIEKLLSFFLVFLGNGFLFAQIAERPIVVLSTSYNNQEWCAKSVRSVLSQEYSNFRFIYIDDHSKDGTADIVESLFKRAHQDSRMMLIRNKERIGALANIYWAVHNYIRDEEIVVSLDGDDWFFDNQVLKKINAAYASGDVWLTHGTMIEYPGSQLGWSIPIPKEIIEDNAFRQYRCVSHLRTFYSWLFKKIALKDLQDGGEFFPMTWDFAIMFPMIEMAGERHAFISDITYVYNTDNQINDNKVNAELQRGLDVVLRNMPPYARLEAAPTFNQSE
jgi:glycosyltransferase involved in cell wall biosynthesis